MERPYQGIQRTLQWIFKETEGEPILEGSAHEQLFWDLADLKRTRSPKLDALLIVFLYNSVPEVRHQRLKDSGRTGEAAVTPLAWDPMVNDLCRLIADVSINTASMTIEDVTSMVRALSDNQQQQTR